MSWEDLDAEIAQEMYELASWESSRGPAKAIAAYDRREQPRRVVPYSEACGTQVRATKIYATALHAPPQVPRAKKVPAPKPSKPPKPPKPHRLTALERIDARRAYFRREYPRDHRVGTHVMRGGTRR